MDLCRFCGKSTTGQPRLKEKIGSVHKDCYEIHTQSPCAICENPTKTGENRGKYRDKFNNPFYVCSTCKTVIPGTPGVSLVELPPGIIHEIVKGPNTFVRLLTMGSVKAQKISCLRRPTAD